MDKKSEHITNNYTHRSFYKNLEALMEEEDIYSNHSYSAINDALKFTLDRLSFKLGITPKYPIDWSSLSIEDKLDTFCEESNCAYREVEFSENWYKGDFGTAIYFDVNHCAKLIESAGKHSSIVFDGELNRSVEILNSKLEKEATLALMFTPTLENKSLTFKDLLNFAYRTNKREFQRMWVFSALAGLIAMLFPLAVGLLFGTVIPSANLGMLLQLGIGLLVITIARELFRLSNNLLTNRLEGWMQWNLQYALVDRVLKLPVSFFKEENSGSMAQKLSNMKKLNEFITTGFSQIVFALFYAVFNLFVLYIFDVKFAFVISLFTFLYLYILYRFLSFQLRKYQEVHEEVIWLDSMVLQFVKGLNKIKQASSETNVLMFWSHYYVKLVKKNEAIDDKRIVFDLLVQNISWLGQALLFILFAFTTVEMSIGDFLGFNAAFFNLFLSITAMLGVLSQLKYVLPVYKDIKPILEELPEISDSSRERIKVKGKISLEQVSFSYNENGPKILNDLSFTVDQGMSIALVGPSGSGKSTILRLLLGFDQPLHGSIYYDEKDLKNLNIKDLRKQFGVVLQNDSLMSGSIFENIAGAQNISLEEAWRAAENASVKEDIEAMPMGMHTLISDHVSTISGGQKQRILIARALAGNPKVLFFDESTSALDNISQKVVTDSLDRLKVTRIIIAHRLSTIKNMDRIFYIEDGKVRESGTFEELMALNGRFKKLAERQME